jgi:hypothetical protein
VQYKHQKETKRATTQTRDRAFEATEAGVKESQPSKWRAQRIGYAAIADIVVRNNERQRDRKAAITILSEPDIFCSILRLTFSSVECRAGFQRECASAACAGLAPFPTKVRYTFNVRAQRKVKVAITAVVRAAATA